MRRTNLFEVLRNHVPDLLIGLVVLFAIILVGAWLMRRLRGRDGEDENAPSEMLTKFGEMHSRGELNEEEYRTIKTVLAAEFQHELKGTAKKG